ncbi:MAG: AMP-binding protein [Burkholderiales bacterium]
MKQEDRYEELYTSFRWLVPDNFNIAHACCTRWAGDPARIALLPGDDGTSAPVTYAQLQAEANRLSNALCERGVAQGDRVAIMLPQRRETVVAHIACYQMGAVAMPLSVLFGPDALEYRLVDSGAVAALTDTQSAANLATVRKRCTQLRTVIACDPGTQDSHDYAALIAANRPTFNAVATHADTPALLIYTSGTTGPPKGALKPHRVLIGNLPGFVASQNWFPQEGDVFWSPADWAWTGGLMDALLPTLYFGRPIVAGSARDAAGRFDARAACELMQRHAVTNVFLFPTALKIIMKGVPRPRREYRLRLRAIMSAGEAVGETLFAWAKSELGVTINEMFGQTEINYVVGNCSSYWPAKPGAIGRPYPGHRVALIDAEGREVPRGTPGEIAVNRNDIHGHPDPVFFLGYWGREDATRAKFSGDWGRTGDEAVMDEDGYLWYQGRADDMFKAAGYRIGPSEVENCLLKHPAIANAAVVPKPDAERGALVKAYIVLVAGVVGDDALKRDIQALVRSTLAPYEYPREIEFIDALPMTTTGKVQRRVLRLAEEERHRSTMASTSMKGNP